MLSSDQSAYVASRFNVYDHNWAFYEELLGESFLLENVLSYCDGAGLYLAAFSLSKAGQIFESNQVIEYLNRAFDCLRGGEPNFINIWGRFQDLPNRLAFPSGAEFHLLDQSEYYSDMFDSIFDVESFEREKPRTASRRLRALARKGVLTNVRRCATFDHEHRSIIERWSKTHIVSVVHQEFFYVLGAYIKRDGVYLCEARSNGTLLGVSVIATIGNERMVVLNSFPLRGDGLRVGDALFAETISFAQKNSVRWIHRGYSAAPSLLRAKESWGATSRSSPYREAFYVRDTAAAMLISEKRFLWRQRLFN
jgi:hypothetical protein